MLIYPVNLTVDSDGTYLVDFVDFPNAHTVGDTIEDALREAVDALLTAIEMYRDSGDLIPLPSICAAGQYSVSIAAQDVANATLFNVKDQWR